MKVNILLTRETFGFKMDASVFETYIGKMYNAEVFLPTDTPRQADVNIFIDSILRPEKLKYAKYNILSVNPEVFLLKKEYRDIQIDIYKKLNAVICKTEYGAEYMEMMKKKYNFTFDIKMFRFTTIFPPLPAKITRSNEKVLHLAGANNWKNTPDVIKTWLEYPDLPPLILLVFGVGLSSLTTYLSKEELERANKSKNIQWIKNEITQEELIKYKHKYRIQLCPSLCEGYGHYINEGRISKAVVITTNSPPMNELITKNSGILLDCSPSQIHKKDNNHSMCYVDTKQIYNGVKAALELTDRKKIELGNNAYKGYQADTVYFGEHINGFLRDLDKPVIQLSMRKSIVKEVDDDFTESYVEDQPDNKKTEYEPFEFKTIKITTKYEKARLISTRAEQIAQGSPVMVDTDGEVDPIKIAFMEYDQKRIPDIIVRYLPRGNETVDYNVNKRVVD